MSEVRRGAEPSCADCGKLLGPGEGRSSDGDRRCARCAAERRPVLSVQSRDLLLGILIGMLCGCFVLVPLVLRGGRPRALTTGVFVGTLIQLMSTLLGLAFAHSFWS